jgi:hypothetical protein
LASLPSPYSGILGDILELKWQLKGTFDFCLQKSFTSSHMPKHRGADDGEDGADGDSCGDNSEGDEGFGWLH